VGIRAQSILPGGVRHSAGKVLCQFEQLTVSNDPGSSTQPSATHPSSFTPDVSSGATSSSGVLPTSTAALPTDVISRSGSSDGLAASIGHHAPASRKRKLGAAADAQGTNDRDRGESSSDNFRSDDSLSDISRSPALRSFILRLHCVQCDCVHAPVEDHKEQLKALLGFENGDEAKLLPALNPVIAQAKAQCFAVQSRLPCHAKLMALHALFNPSARVAAYDAADVPSPELLPQPVSTVAARAASDTFRHWSTEMDAAFKVGTREHAVAGSHSDIRQVQCSLQPMWTEVRFPPIAAQLGNTICASDPRGKWACITFEQTESPSYPTSNSSGSMLPADRGATAIKVRCSCHSATGHDVFCPFAAGTLRGLSGNAPSKVFFHVLWASSHRVLAQSSAAIVCKPRSESGFSGRLGNPPHAGGSPHAGHDSDEPGDPADAR